MIFRNFYRWHGMSLLALLLIFCGCDDRKSTKTAAKPRGSQTAATPAAPGQPSPEDDIVAVWEAKMGDPIVSKMTLDVRDDKTFRLTNFMPDAQDPAKSITNVSEGRWHLEPEHLVLDLERSLSGGQIPPEQKQLKLWAGGSVKGHWFTDLCFDPSRREGHFERKAH